MKKIIIFGGSGFIGSYFCQFLLKKKYVITIYDLTKPNFSHKSLKFIKGNIVNKNDVINAIKGHNFVMNFAGWADIETADSAHTEVIDQNVGILDTYIEPVRGMEILVQRTTILRTGAISSGNFQ